MKSQHLWLAGCSWSAEDPASEHSKTESEGYQKAPILRQDADSWWFLGKEIQFLLKILLSLVGRLCSGGWLHAQENMGDPDLTWWVFLKMWKKIGTWEQFGDLGLDLGWVMAGVKINMRKIHCMEKWNSKTIDKNIVKSLLLYTSKILFFFS